MSDVGKRVIWVGPADGANQKPNHVEGKAVEAGIKPGMGVYQSTTGIIRDNNAVTVRTNHLIADKDELRTKSVDDAWTINENMVAISPRSGEFMNVLVAATQDINRIGMPLTRAGASLQGLFKIAVLDGTDDIICYADEIIDTTGDPATGTLVRVSFA